MEITKYTTTHVVTDRNQNCTGELWLVNKIIFSLLGRTSLPSLSRVTRRPWKAGRRNTSASCQQSVAQVIVHQKHVSHESGPQRSRSTTRSTPAHLGSWRYVRERQQRGSKHGSHDKTNPAISIKLTCTADDAPTDIAACSSGDRLRSNAASACSPNVRIAARLVRLRSDALSTRGGATAPPVTTYIVQACWLRGEV